MSRVKKPEADKPTRTRTDWDAVERDYRATSLTLREIGAKHGVSHVAVMNKAKQREWIRGDLAKVVRDATAAALIQKTVTDDVTAAYHGLTEAVAAQVTINTRVVTEHRTRLTKLLRDADAASVKLMALADKVSDVREASVLVGAIESLTRTTAKIIEKERQAYDLDDNGRGGDGGYEQKLEDVITELEGQQEPHGAVA